MSYIQGSSTAASKTHETSTLFVVKHMMTSITFGFFIKPNYFVDITFTGNILKKQKKIDCIFYM